MEDAIADYTRVLASLPDDATLFSARAHAHQRLGDFQRAAADLSRAIQLAPQSPDAYAQRGNLAAEQGKYEQAMRDFQWAVEIDANCADAYRGLAWLRATCTDPDIRSPEASLQAAERAAELSPADDYLILDTIAAAHACGGNFDEAIRLEEKALAAAPRDVSTALEHRLSLYQQGRAFVSRPADANVRTVSHESTEPPSPPAQLESPTAPSSRGPRPSPRSASS
jgi:tetratricopeptide (TPR) repeat protein